MSVHVTRIESPTLESLSHSLAGGLAGMIALLLLYPIEQLNTRTAIKSEARILTPQNMLNDFLHLRIKNIIDIYRGLPFALLEKFFFLAVYFFFYSYLKNDWKRRYAAAYGVDEMPMHVALLRGCVAGILTQIFTSPLNTITRILQTTNSDDVENGSASQIFRTVSSKHGFGALWSGFGMSMLLVVNPAINFYAYEYLKDHIRAAIVGHDAMWIDFVSGLLSKALATVFCYPLIYVKYNLQADNAAHSADSKRSACTIICCTWSVHGVTGFYKGMQTKLVLSSLNDAFMFMFKEKVVLYTFAGMLWCATRYTQMDAWQIASVTLALVWCLILLSLAVCYMCVQCCRRKTNEDLSKSNSTACSEDAVALLHDDSSYSDKDMV
eukprot:CAMPEP_0202704508 /NCGR_PEP_ID=MMETSP1385-20130828/17175_1 /ASSEMBLY_ACC=CAM_ASM_000861 /TAXON_ID=933848 /ORGANISM="Elphidium margaritaceum" /LENGTH=380 /DNA_ID=CAMNT_0049362553 /DNA_START=27 /DNA_END=1169 /DNA_ORIENTATION=-